MIRLFEDLRGRGYELNAWLLDKCIAYAKVHRHPELTEQTIWRAFEAERPKLVLYAGRFDGFHALPASVSKTCLVRFDNNKYSVAASAVGRPVEVHAYADRIVIRQDGRIHAAISKVSCPDTNQRAKYFPHVQFGSETSMEKDDPPETQAPNSDARKTHQERQGAIATAEYLERDAALATKTAGLREQRLAREADAAAARDETENPSG